MFQLRLASTCSHTCIQRRMLTIHMQRRFFASMSRVYAAVHLGFTWDREIVPSSIHNSGTCQNVSAVSLNMEPNILTFHIAFTPASLLHASFLFKTAWFWKNAPFAKPASTFTCSTKVWKRPEGLNSYSLPWRYCMISSQSTDLSLFLRSQVPCSLVHFLWRDS